MTKYEQIYGVYNMERMVKLFIATFLFVSTSLAQIGGMGFGSSGGGSAGPNLYLDSLFLSKYLGLSAGATIATHGASHYGWYRADTTIFSVTRGSGNEPQTILRSHFSAIYAPSGHTFAMGPFRMPSGFYISDAVTDYTNFRPYLEVTTPHGVLNVQRYGPYSYSSVDDIAASKMRMTTNSHLTTQANLTGGILGIMDVGSSHPAGIYSSGGAYVPNIAYGIGGNVNNYANGKVPLGAGGIFQVNTLGGTGGFRRGMNIYTPRPVNAIHDTTVGWYYQGPGSIPGARFAAILEDSGKIAWSGVMLYRSGTKTLAVDGSLRIGGSGAAKIDSVTVNIGDDSKLNFYTGGSKYVAFNQHHLGPEFWFGFSDGTFDIPSLEPGGTTTVIVPVTGLDINKPAAILISDNAWDTEMQTPIERDLEISRVLFPNWKGDNTILARTQLDLLFPYRYYSYAHSDKFLVVAHNYGDSYRPSTTSDEVDADGLPIPNYRYKNEPLIGLSNWIGFMRVNGLILNRIWSEIVDGVPCILFSIENANFGLATVPQEGLRIMAIQFR